MQTEILKIVFPFLISLIITATIIPKWISLCSKWKLFDKPDSRKHHTAVIPTLGGIAIYAGIIISFFLFSKVGSGGGIQFVIASSFILFFTGFFDDLTDIPAKRKLIIQLFAASLVIAGGIRIQSLGGLFGIYQIPFATQFIVTAFIILFLTNAYNFVDGIDGLAASIGIIVIGVFGTLFFFAGELNYSILCICAIGALVAFLYFNFDPAKVFMGDTGSLVIGFFISVCSIKLFALQNTVALSGFNILPQLIIGTLFVLIFDLTRVVFIRIFNGISPFKADRSHLHHMVCRQEFGHRGATVILAMFNLFFISLAFVLKYLSAEIFTLICFCLAILLLNSKVISVFALVRNKLAGIPKKKFGVDSSV